MNGITIEDFNKAEADETVDLFQCLSDNKKYMKEYMKKIYANKHITSLYSMLNETKATNKSE